MKIPSKYPTLKKVLAEIDAPLFSGATVEVDCWTSQEEGQTVFNCDPDTANLLLPEVDQHQLDSMGLPKAYEIVVRHGFETEQAMSATYYFTFDVEISGSTQQPDGMYELQYTAQVKEWSYET